MHTRVVSIMLIAGLALTACGGGGEGGSGSKQDQVADMMIDSLNEAMDGEGVAGVSVDEDCVRDATGELSDSDAQKLLDAGPDGEADLSDAAEQAAGALLDCIDIDFGDLDIDVDS